MKNLYPIVLIGILMLTATMSNAQELMNYQQPKDYELPPKLIPTVRKYWVSLPKDYDKSKSRYPVLFVFDGNEAYMRNYNFKLSYQFNQPYHTFVVAF